MVIYLNFNVDSTQMKIHFTEQRYVMMSVKNPSHGQMAL